MEDVWFELSVAELAFLVQAHTSETSVLDSITPIGAWFGDEAVKSAGEGVLAERIKAMPVELDAESWSRIVAAARVLGDPSFASLLIVERADGSGLSLITCVDPIGAAQLAVSSGSSGLRAVPWPLPVAEMAADLAAQVAGDAGVSLRLLRNSRGSSPDGLIWSAGKLAVLAEDGATVESDIELSGALAIFAAYAGGNDPATRR